jgi:ligand-binding sensor domain-containing protein
MPFLNHHVLFRLGGLILFWLTGLCGYAQTEKYHTIDMNNGLPSNYVYRTMEDKDGYLWVATDAGLGRYDGKHFQWFTTKDGLPDNVVLAIVVEKDGTVWVNCFKQCPTYFDKVKNRFIKALDEQTLPKISTTLNMYLFALPNGGVTYINNKGCFVFKQKKLVPYQNTFYKYFLFAEFSDGSQFRLKRGTFLHVKGKRIIDSVQVKLLKSQMFFENDSNNLYLFSKQLGRCYLISNITTYPLRYHIDSVTVPESFNNFSITETSLYIIGLSGKIYVFDKKTLKQSVIPKGDYLPNSYYNDSKGNIWISTIDKGLLVYRNQQLKAVEMPVGYNRTNFLSLERKENGQLLAGNYYGEVLETGIGKAKVHTITNMVTSRIRKILIVGDDIFTFSEEGTFYNYKNQIFNPKTGGTFASKTAIKFNDSTILVGTHWNVLILNTRTKKLIEKTNTQKRTTALVKGSDQWAYFGSNDGLYKYDVNTGNYYALSKLIPSLNDRITALCFTPDHILWVATATSGIIALKNDKLLGDATKKLTQTYTHIISGKPGQIWAATPQGINVIDYQLAKNRIEYAIQNLTVTDGLRSNTVQEMVYQNGKVYAANGGGIAIIPDNFKAVKFNIITRLIRLSINQQDTIIANNYVLKHGQQSIQMQFAGVDLTGHFKRLQYTLDKNKGWIDLAENTLTVQLSSGEHLVQVRSIDANDNISSHTLTIKFNIETPFWRSIWFWLALGFIFQLFTIYSINKWLKKKKERKLAKQISQVQTAALEQQAFTSLMNPHFIFNALNSIQHYINVQDRQNANRYLSDFASLIRLNFEAAQQSFIPLEEEIENIKLYLNLEQMRFDDHFSYQIKIDKDVDVEDWMIPTMILQPLLENALLHGIMPSHIAGKIMLNFKHQDRNLLILIIDNGIGLVNSNALKAISSRKSRGMELIKKRIKALCGFGSEPITIAMEPAFKSKKNPGNKITLLIPLSLHEAWRNAKHS